MIEKGRGKTRTTRRALKNWPPTFQDCVTEGSGPAQNAGLRDFHTQEGGQCPKPKSAQVHVVAFRPSKPQNFHLFSRLAPTPLISCLKVCCSRVMSASTSLAQICRREASTSLERRPPAPAHNEWPNPSSAHKWKRHLLPEAGPDTRNHTNTD